MTATREAIGARVDALAQAHEGEAFVEAVRALAAELGPEEQQLLREALLERAADEENFRKAAGRRFAEKGWTRRTFARFERLWGEDRAGAVAEAIRAGPEGRDALELEAARLRGNPGRGALVLDALSRHGDARVRGWVPGAAGDLLGASGVSVRLVLSLTRDRDAGVRRSAFAVLLRLDRDAARAAAPDLRRRLHSSDLGERVHATWALAEIGDATSLPHLAERAESAVDPAERAAAAAAALVLRGDAAAVAAGLSSCQPQSAAALAAAARILATEETVAALRTCAVSAPHEACREACSAELSRLDEEV
ncbi:MAG TPA: HEAT repeat domain-containing protein [Gaiellaceae bacterium]|nr:HEAT repeat domain-containing protein [Gaiellaceae bacterium]